MAATLLCRRIFSPSKLYSFLSQASRLIKTQDTEIQSLSRHMSYDIIGKIPSEKEGSTFCVQFGEDTTRRTPIVSFMVHELDPPRLYELNLYLRNFMSYDSKPHLARQVVAQMLVRGTIPNLSTFSLVLKSYCKCKQTPYQHVLDLFFTQMKALGVKADDSFYETMVSRVGDCFGPYVGFHLIKKLRSSQGIPIPLSCYSVVVCQLCQMKMINNASAALILTDVFIDMEQQWIFPEEEICHRLLQLCNRGGEDLLKAVGIGRLLFAKGMRIGAYAKVE